MIRMVDKPSGLVLAATVVLVSCVFLFADERSVELGLPTLVEPPKPSLGLNDLVGLAVEQNPELRRAQAAIARAQGEFVQAGLYPNPRVDFLLNELGDVTGPQGINTLPLISQEFLTPGKRQLRKAVAGKQVEQADLGLVQRRYQMLTQIRQAFFKVLAIQQRLDVLDDLVKQAKLAYDRSDRLVRAKQIAELDLIQFRISLNRFRANFEATKREQLGAWKLLVATVGTPDLPVTPLRGSLKDPLPDYDSFSLRARMLAVHPEILSAEVGVAKAELSLRRAKLERIPNITLGAGYVRQNQNVSDDWTIEFGMPVPIFNRNQGNIQAARADIARSVQQVYATRNVLSGRLATAVARYRAARERVKQYRDKILPDVHRAYHLALAGFQGGQFEYLRVLEAQRSLAEVNLEYIESLSVAWQAASEIAGLILQDDWPPRRPHAGRTQRDPDQPFAE